MKKRNRKRVNQEIKKVAEEYCRKINKLNLELQECSFRERHAE